MELSPPPVGVTRVSWPTWRRTGRRVSWPGSSTSSSVPLPSTTALCTGWRGQSSSPWSSWWEWRGTRWWWCWWQSPGPSTPPPTATSSPSPWLTSSRWSPVCRRSDNVIRKASNVTKWKKENKVYIQKISQTPFLKLSFFCEELPKFISVRLVTKLHHCMNTIGESNCLYLRYLLLYLPDSGDISNICIR